MDLPDSLVTLYLSLRLTHRWCHPGSASITGLLHLNSAQCEGGEPMRIKAQVFSSHIKYLRTVNP